MSMNIDDYLIDQSGLDWGALLSGWSHLLPDNFTLWFVSRLADVFVVLTDGSVHMLDVGIYTLRRLADSREEFFQKMNTGNFAAEWFATNLVNQCVEAGVLLESGQCYGYKMPPLLGGAYSVENLYPLDIEKNYSFLTDIYKQTQDIPDGTVVSTSVKQQTSISDPIDRA